MIKIAVATVNFSNALKAYAEATGKGLGESVKEQAILLAKALVKYTYPASASQGKRRVQIDVNRVYLRNEWFEEVFQFTQKKLGERVIDLVREKNEGGLRAIFERSKRLQAVRIEPFDAGLHGRMRQNGRIGKGFSPHSFPLAQQASVKALTRKRQANVGTAKSGWANALQTLGKGIPAWLTKAGTGSVADHSADPKNPYIVLTNRVPYFKALDDKAGIVERALEGRARAMEKSAEKQLELARKAAGL